MAKRKTKKELESLVRMIITMLGNDYDYMITIVEREGGGVSMFDSCEKNPDNDQEIHDSNDERLNLLANAISEILERSLDEDIDDNPAIRMFNVIMSIFFNIAENNENIRRGMIRELEKVGGKAIQIRMNQTIN